MNSGSHLEWLGEVSASDLCDLKNNGAGEDVRGLFCFYGSWNRESVLEKVKSLLHKWEPSMIRKDRRYVVGMVCVDQSDESMSVCLNDDGCEDSVYMGCPPEELPAFAVGLQDKSMDHARLDFIEGIKPLDLFHESSKVWESVQCAFNSLILHKSFPSSATKEKRSIPEAVPTVATRLFVAGDRSSVGKSSVCMGLLGNLLKQGYEPSSLAYIKPATQCEATQLVQKFCESRGIECVPVGPVVYFKGFTRAFLSGETETTAELLGSAKTAVDKIATNKKVVLIDGVGYPAVGSICGTDNAAVARACGYDSDQPLAVLIVGPSGVGNAVDSYNLNATYFMSQDLPVIGAIFNKLSQDGYYSVKNCREQVERYFDRFQPDRKAFGFVPMFPRLSEENALDYVDEFIGIFGENVDVKGILQAANIVRRTKPNSNKQSQKKVKVKLSEPLVSTKRKLKTSQGGGLSSRQRIEQSAIAAGAAPSA